MRSTADSRPFTTIAVPSPGTVRTPAYQDPSDPWRHWDCPAQAPPAHLTCWRPPSAATCGLSWMAARRTNSVGPPRGTLGPAQQHTELDSAVAFTDLDLRRHGCWPAVLASGEPWAAAWLVVALGRAVRVVAPGLTNVAGRPLDGSGLALRLQLRAQLGSRHGCHIDRGWAQGCGIGVGIRTVLGPCCGVGPHGLLPDRRAWAGQRGTALALGRALVGPGAVGLAAAGATAALLALLLPVPQAPCTCRPWLRAHAGSRR